MNLHAKIVYKCLLNFLHLPSWNALLSTWKQHKATDLALAKNLRYYFKFISSLINKLNINPVIKYVCTVCAYIHVLEKMNAKQTVLC